MADMEGKEDLPPIYMVTDFQQADMESQPNGPKSPKGLYLSSVWIVFMSCTGYTYKGIWDSKCWMDWEPKIMLGEDTPS